MASNRLYGLDHLRSLAIILVFIYHYQLPFFGHPGWLPNVAKFGWTGVDLFFVLSGYLISSQLFLEIKEKGTLSVRSFFIKRSLRILPAFWTTIAIYFFLPSFRERESLPAAWKFFAFIQNFDLDIKNYGTFSHAWSLCVEEHFYFVFPLLLLFLLSVKQFRKGYWILIPLFILGFLLRHLNWNLYNTKIEEDNSWMYWYKYVYYPSYNRLDGLLVGVSIAAVHYFAPSAWKQINQFGNWWFILGLTVIIASYFLSEKQRSYEASVFGFPLIAIGYGAFVLAAVCESSFLSKWKSRSSSLIALLSFSVYLTHKGIIKLTQSFLEEHGYDINSNYALLLSIFTCLLGALTLNLIIERPFLKLRGVLLKSTSLK